MRPKTLTHQALSRLVPPLPQCGRGLDSSVDLQQFDVEHQRRVRRDHASSATRAVAELGRDDQRALAADLHAGDALVPALDHLLRAETEREGLAAIQRAVEFLPLLAVG